MRIEHIAVWTEQLEGMRAFYETYFHARSSPLYSNPRTGFHSYFLSFAGGARLELMQMEGSGPNPNVAGRQSLGYAHLAMAVGSETAVDLLTGRLRAAGYAIIGEPRRTGDGYYESVILDPEGNRIEITI
jgi:lactoylglutathione lyase